jgi:hypothetical protein
VVQNLGAEQDAVDGFGWSVALLAKGLVRTILEGSTIVMKAINTNSIETNQESSWLRTSWRACQMAVVDPSWYTRYFAAPVVYTEWFFRRCFWNDQ